jgi:signal transduction histidine kinase
LYHTFFIKNIDALKHKIAENENAVNEIGLAKAILEKQNEDLHRLNAQYLEAKEKAEESDKLKTAFLHNVSHEIRTPLNAIMGFVEILRKPEITEEKRDKYVAIITKNCNQLLTVITDIITISAIETNQEMVKIEQVDINKLLSELRSVFETHAQVKKLELKVTPCLPDNESIVYTDYYKIKQILTKLLSNALKFTSKGYVEFGYRLKNNNLIFFVKDTGIGIHAEHQKIIFEHFSPANLLDQSNSGTGLGLSISKGLANLIGGEIWVESEPDNGTVFSFSVPYRTVL